MCSVIGFSGQYESFTLEKIFFNSQIRGVHAFGYAFFCDKELIVKKYFNYNDFLKSIHNEKPNKFIAHFRYSTSGDYLIEQNNQPIFKNNQAMVFNGVISQKSLDEMRKEYDCPIESDNDGWILFDKFFDLEQLKDTSMTFASLFFKNNQITALRNKKRPLWKGVKNKNLFIASTNDILTRSGIDNASEIKPFSHVQW